MGECSGGCLVAKVKGAARRLQAEADVQPTPRAGPPAFKILSAATSSLLFSSPNNSRPPTQIIAIRPAARGHSSVGVGDSDSGREQLPLLKPSSRG